MKLTAFKAKHFRCLFDTDWIPISEMSIFTGENDGGKSATLEALEIFLNPKSSPSRDDYSYVPITPDASVSDDREDEITLSARFGLRDPESALLKATWGIEDITIEVKRSFRSDAAQTPNLIAITAQTYSDDVFKKPLDDYSSTIEGYCSKVID
jgi:predicted ATP-dependent endonuclease of OLD family